MLSVFCQHCVPWQIRYLPVTIQGKRGGMGRNQRERLKKTESEKEGRERQRESKREKKQREKEGEI